VFSWFSKKGKSVTQSGEQSKKPQPPRWYCTACSDFCENTSEEEKYGHVLQHDLYEKCSICSAMFAKASADEMLALKSHSCGETRRASGSWRRNMLVCGTCKVQFKKFSDLHSHFSGGHKTISTKTEKGGSADDRWPCQKCNSIFTNAWDWNDHECKTVKERFDAFSSILASVGKPDPVASVKSVRCSICGNTFTGQDAQSRYDGHACMVKNAGKTVYALMVSPNRKNFEIMANAALTHSKDSVVYVRGIPQEETFIKAAKEAGATVVQCGGASDGHHRDEAILSKCSMVLMFPSSEWKGDKIAKTTVGALKKEALVYPDVQNITEK
jgi:hypothetical protein